MRIRVRLFAIAKQMAGRECVEVEVPQPATVAQLRACLASEAPQLAGLLGQVMFAVNAQYVADSATVSPETEIACIPPVSGG